MKKNELYDWLESQGSSGDFESEGHFTLEREEAWAKLTAFQFPVQEGWVLKLVQAMSATPEARLSVRQFANETVFTISYVSGWLREPVEEGVLALDLRSKTSIDHISMALRILVQMQDRPFSVTYCDGEKVVWTGGKFIQIKAPEKTNSEEVVSTSKLNIRFKPSHAPHFQIRVGHFTFQKRSNLVNFGASDGVRVAGNIAGALRQNCHLSRDPIYVDSSLITPGLNDQDFGTPSFGRPLAFLPVTEALELQPFQTAPTKRAPRADFGNFSANLDQGMKYDPKENQECYAAGLLSVFLRKHQSKMLGARNSKILWINDGVIVHRETLDMEPGPVGLAIVLSSEGLETDISGMTPRETDEMQRRRVVGIAALHQHLEQLDNELGPNGVKIRRKIAGAVGAGTFGAALWGLKVPFLGVPLLLIGTTQYAYGYASHAGMSKELRRALSNLVTNLGKLASNQAQNHSGS